ncbi:sodium-independent sulfate anion transporter [Hydra vulgaris]|uniref:sodium-independent sulfate anion transporter n=1 Tax=Hydra vulgaris TaxID=6087 RepID=UPI00019251EF|nr:sodium-independent sulfate anion transporter [Hydra vulgaris]
MNIFNKVCQISWLKWIKSFFPILIWLPQYNLQKLRKDIVAGITVGVMVIPQSMAFANLANLSSEYGLYASFTPGIIYCIFGTSRHINIGPTVTMALFSTRFNPTFHPIGASFLGLLTGFALVIMAIFRLAFVTKFFPHHVISAFVSATSIIAVITQLSSLFGIKDAPSNAFLIIAHIFKKIKLTNIWDLSLGLSSILFLFFFMWLSKRNLFSNSKSYINVKALLKKIIWFFCASRMALLCLCATTVVYIFHLKKISHKFSLGKKIPSGLPRVQIPFQSVDINNKTVTASDFLDSFGTSIIVLPIVQFIFQISIGKSFARKFNYKIDSTQELIALGLSNSIGSFFGAWPVCASFSRSAVNAMCGAETPFAGVFSSLVVLLAMEFLTPVFYFIPKSALAAMIIMAVILMIEPHVPRSIWKLNKLDLLPYFVAFGASFYYLEAGLLSGTAVSLLIILYKEAKPRHVVKNSSLKRSVTLLYNSNLTYPGVESLGENIYSIIRNQKYIKSLKLDMSNSSQLDYSALKDMKSLQSELSEISVTLGFTNFSCEYIKAQFIKAGLIPAHIEAVENNDEDDGDVTEQFSESIQNKNFETNALITNSDIKVTYGLPNHSSTSDFKDACFYSSNDPIVIIENQKKIDGQTTAL